MTKYWTSDGDEQRELEKLFRDKEVNSNMKPKDVQSKYAIFKDFSPAVFRKHWTLTKNKFLSGFEEYRDIDETSNATTIPEVDGSQLYTPSTSNEPQRKKVKFEVPANDVFSYGNPPILFTIFIDPESKEKKLCVTMLLHEGVKEVEFDIEGEKEQTLKLTYNWNQKMMSANDMVTKENGEMIFPPLHPLVIGLDQALMAVKPNLEEPAYGTVSAKLPVNVKTDAKFWEKYFNKTVGGSIILFLVFLCSDNEYAEKKTEKSLKFD